jgi:hypothetical protein
MTLTKTPRLTATGRNASLWIIGDSSAAAANLSESGGRTFVAPLYRHNKPQHSRGDRIGQRMT